MTNYKTDKLGNEIYTKQNNKEEYAKHSNGNEIYAKRKSVEYYALNEQSEQYYARYEKCEYYAINIARDEFFIQVGNTQYYAKKDNGAEFYPKRRSGKEVLAKKNGIKYYAKDSLLNEFYPKDQYGNEYKIGWDNFAKLSNGEIFYPKDAKGDPIYYIKDKKELYFPDNPNKKPTFAKNICGDEVYAKNESLIEYYPLVKEKPVYARYKTGRLKYAKNENDEIIYPTFNNTQIYMSDSLFSSFRVLEKSDFRGFVMYARNNEKEMYPTITTDNGDEIDMVVNNTYAKILSTDECYYPLDSNNNEYVKNDGEFIKNAGYPITNDGFIIIPIINNVPRFIKNNTEVTERDVKNLLYRPFFHTYDFITNKKSSRKPNTDNLVIYNTLPNNLNSQKMNLYIIAGLVFIIFILMFLLI